MQFHTLSKPEADAYLAVFLAEESARLQSLRTRWQTSGASPDALDTSPESLERLWAWAMPRIERQGDNDAPRALPSWASEHVEFTQFSDESLALVDEIARYFGAVILRNVPGARWAVARMRVKGYMDQNWPAIALLDDFVNPVQLVMTAAISQLNQPAAARVDRLRTAYEFTTRLARERIAQTRESDVDAVAPEGA